MKKEMTQKFTTKLNSIHVGDFGNEGNNTDVLKKLFWIIPNSESPQDLIDSCDTSIRVNLR